MGVPHVEEVRITAKPDQLLEPLPEGDSYLGFIFARGPTSRRRRGRAAPGALAAHVRDPADVRVVDRELTAN